MIKNKANNGKNMQNPEEQLILNIPEVNKNIYKFILGKRSFRDYNRENLAKFCKLIRRKFKFPMMVQFSDGPRPIEIELVSISMDKSKYQVPEKGIIAIVRDSHGKKRHCGLYSFTTIKNEFNPELDLFDYYRYWWRSVSDDYYEE